MVIELGRLCFEPQTKKVTGDKVVLNNRIAFDVNGKSTYIDIVAWGKTAELIESKYKKGYEILLEGSLINQDKKIKDTEHTYSTVALLVNRVTFTHGNPKAVEVDDDFLNGVIGAEAPDFLGNV